MKGDIIKVFSVNLIKMFATLITTFLIPSILSVENYGQYKLYLFYIAYIGASHLGFCDGIYLKYGGMKKEDIDSKSISVEHTTILVFEMFISLLIFLLAVIKKDFCLVILALTNVPLILVGFYNFIFQAIGDFQKYTRNQLIATIINLVFSLVLICFRVDDYKIYVLCHCIIQYISCIIVFVYFKQDKWLTKSKASFRVLCSNIQIGFLLLIGNFVYNLFVGLDKWFIKFSLDITDFSMYSFASQLLSVINMFVTPIGLTLYSNISRRKDVTFEKKVEKLLIVLLMLCPLSVYIMDIIIQMFLTKYTVAMGAIAILFVSHIFMSINSIFFVNVYKAYKMQKQYFLRMCLALMFTFLMNVFVLAVAPTIEHFALATLLSAIVWFVLNCHYFKRLTPDIRLIAFMVVLLFVFGIGFSIDGVLIRILVYLMTYIVLIKVLLNDVWEYGEEQIKRIYIKLKSGIMY